MDDLDIIKQQWQRLAARTEALEQANQQMARQLASNKISSLQDRLANRISRLGWLGFVLPILAPLLYYLLNLPWWIAIAYAVFGIIMAALSLWIAEYIRAEDLASMPVAQALKRAVNIKKYQNRSRIFGIACCAVIIAGIVLMAPAGPEREAILIGGSIGFVIGLAFGIHRCIINARLTRDLIKSFS